MEIKYTPEGEVMKLISLARWIIQNSEAAPQIYIDPETRGQWRRSVKKWLTEADDLLGLNPNQ
jgi:hypothetical protein